MKNNAKAWWAVFGVMGTMVGIASLSGYSKTPADKEAIASLEKLADLSTTFSGYRRPTHSIVQRDEWMADLAEAEIKVKALDSEDQPEFKDKLHESLKEYQNVRVLWMAQPAPGISWINCNPAFDTPRWPYNAEVCEKFSGYITTGRFMDVKTDTPFREISISAWRGSWTDHDYDHLQDAEKKAPN